jgi:spermidine synthase
MYTNGKFQGDDGPEMDSAAGSPFPRLFLTQEASARHRSRDRDDAGHGRGLSVRGIRVAGSLLRSSRRLQRYYTGPSRGRQRTARFTVVLNDGRNVLLTIDPTT